MFASREKRCTIINSKRGFIGHLSLSKKRRVAIRIFFSWRLVNSWLSYVIFRRKLLSSPHSHSWFRKELCIHSRRVYYRSKIRGISAKPSLLPLHPLPFASIPCEFLIASVHVAEINQLTRRSKSQFSPKNHARVNFRPLLARLISLTFKVNFFRILPRLSEHLYGAIRVDLLAPYLYKRTSA